MAAAAATTTTTGTNGVTNGITTATDGDGANGAAATTVGTRDPNHVNQTAGAPAAVPETGNEKSGPCGLPSKCEIL